MTDPAEHPRYSISVAAELAGMHPQTLRMYDAKGVVSPRRTPGGTRRYSDSDVARLRKKPDGKPRLVLAYLSVGEAEDYRAYWKKGWKEKPPAWLGPESPVW